MSDIKISEMTETQNLNNNDVVPIVQNGANKKISFINMVRNFIANKLILNNQSDSTTEAYSADYINKNVGFEIVENENGTAIKYANGIMIVTQSYTHTTTSWSAWGNAYTATMGTPPNYPVAFVEVPIVIQTLSTPSVNAWLGTRNESGGSNTTTRAAAMQLIRPTSVSGSNAFTIDIIAIGKWK